MAGLYDVFVDWQGRLDRELPGILARLRAAGARRVLDAGCGTGRHVEALLREGFDAHGADVSEEMLEQARALTGAPERFHAWRMGEPLPASLEAASFDAFLCVGNVWPQLTDARDVAATLDAIRRLLRPGGVVLLGLKAVEVRRAAKNPYLPLLKRTHEGRPLWFIRFVDFDTGERDIADFHMAVVGDGDEALLHRSTRIRVWSPAALRAAFEEAGFKDVDVSARIGEPGVPPATEDVFVHARST